MLFVAPPPKRYNVLNMILVEMFVCLFVCNTQLSRSHVHDPSSHSSKASPFLRTDVPGCSVSYVGTDLFGCCGRLARSPERRRTCRLRRQRMQIRSQKPWGRVKLEPFAESRSVSIIAKFDLELESRTSCFALDRVFAGMVRWMLIHR